MGAMTLVQFTMVRGRQEHAEGKTAEGHTILEFYENAACVKAVPQIGVDTCTSPGQTAKGYRECFGR